MATKLQSCHFKASNQKSERRKQDLRFRRNGESSTWELKTETRLQGRNTY